jgi:hypothetical protein
MAQDRFLPIKIVRHSESYQVIFGTEQGAWFYLYFEDEPGRRDTMKRMTEADALLLAKRIARTLTEAWS